MNAIINLTRTVFVIALTATLAACAGDDSSSDVRVGGGGIGGSGDGGTQTAEGGIGGSGSGTMTGYGSIIVNEIRHFLIPDDTIVLLDGESVPASGANATDQVLPIGTQVEFLIGEDAASNMRSGTARVVSARHNAIGPVTGLAPLSVLGQPVQVTGDTVLDGVGSATGLTLSPGDIAAVSGVPESFGAVRATLLAARDSNTSQWLLAGRVDNADAAGFDINGQAVLLNGVLPENCGAGLENGDRVVVKASRDSGFMSDPVLDTVTSVTCLADGISLLADATVPASLPVSFEGIISALEATTSVMETILVLDGQRVRVSLETVPDLVFGTLNDLTVGTHLEVEGSLDTTTGIIDAQRIYFRDPLVRITAPVEAASAGMSLETLGLTVYGALNLTEDGSAIFTNGVDNRQVSVTGFADSNNVIYANEILDVGAENGADIDLYGPITDIDLAGGTFSVLGVAFDLDSAASVSLGDLTVEVDGICLDLLNGCDSSLTSNELLSQVGTNSVADIQGATYSALILQDGSIAFND